MKRITAVSILSLFAALTVAALSVFSPAAPTAAQTIAPGGSTPACTRYGAPKAVTLMAVTGITRSMRGRILELGNYCLIDVQYVVSMSGTNTVTIQMQHSNNQSNWTTGQSVATVGASGAGVTSTINAYQYTAPTITLNSNGLVTMPVTVTITGWAK